jgi:hypothetical protein
MSKSLIVMWMGCMPALPLSAQADSVIINVGESSKVIFAIGDKKDLETLKQYDFQAVVNDLAAKLEAGDSTTLDKPAEAYVKQEETTPEEYKVTTEDDDEDWDESWEKRRNENRYEYNGYRDSRRSDRNYYGRRTRHSFNIDLGMNNYIGQDDIPDFEPYTVKQWGSWYVALNATERTRVGRTFFLEWGAGVSWYNFKYENESVVMGMDSIDVSFTPSAEEVEFVKSKLTAAYVNAFLIPVFDFGGNSRKAMFFDGHHSESFRIGAGPYVGYRIDSYTKNVFKAGGDKHKDHNHQNFYLDNLRYGLRLQIGFRDCDVFVNYDLNELYTAGKGPRLNAFSFGITL